MANDEVEMILILVIKLVDSCVPVLLAFGRFKLLDAFLEMRRPLFQVIDTILSFLYALVFVMLLRVGLFIIIYLFHFFIN